MANNNNDNNTAKLGLQNMKLVAHQKGHGSNAVKRYTEGGLEYTNKGRYRENVMCMEVYFETHYFTVLHACLSKLKTK